MSGLFHTLQRFPARHGFSLRGGGRSTGPHASLNLGFSVGDAPAAVEANLRALLEEARLPPSALHTVSQVHGATVLEAPAPGPASAALNGPLGEADAVLTVHPGGGVGVRAADCVPILLADAGGPRVAAVHSGWRGTEARICARGVEALAARGSAVADLHAAVGPAIRRCCYEVSPELAERFEATFGQGAVDRSRATPHLDLIFCVRSTLEQAGVQAAHVHDAGLCTACAPDRFYSHRRDRGLTGRHLAFVIA